MFIQCSGYVSPEYVQKGTYSVKSDVYSFGVLLLQIISGKKNTCFYGLDQNLHLLEYVSYFETSLTSFWFQILYMLYNMAC